MKVVHVITGLPDGGAERSLYRLLAAMDRRRYDQMVVTLTDGGSLRPMFDTLGLPIVSLGMRAGMIDPRAVIRLWRILRRERPDIVQSWMYHADLLAGLVAPLAGRPPVVWNLRIAEIEGMGISRMTVLVARLSARLSRRLPTRIVCVSESARESHAAMGYDRSRMVVIPNGYDLERLAPDPAARQRVRDELGVPDDVPLIGIAARFDPIKDLRTFIQAAARVRERVPSVRIIMCGEGIDADNAELMGWLDAAGMTEQIRLLGRRSDMPRLYTGLDVLVSSSITEGFPNTLAEAMACGVPCAATDVGDAARIVGETGRIVAPRNPEALADAVVSLIELGPEDRHALGLAARARIASEFSMAATVQRYEAVYATAVGA